VKVAHVHRIRGIGGSERHLLALLPALRALDVDARMVGLDDPAWDVAPFYAALDAAGVPYERLVCRRDLEPRLVPALRRLDVDVLHTHLVHADLYGALGRGRARLVSTKHNDDPFRAGTFRFVERVLAARTSRVIAITEALRQFCVERVGLPADKLEVVHYGLDAPPEAWGPNPDLDLPKGARLLVAVSRLEEQKGLDVALRALAQLPPEAVLVVLGEGPQRAELEALARQLGVADRVRLPGRVGDVAALLRQAELLVHPARWEGFGLALLEAMLCAKPIVASRVSSIPELVADGETGLLVPPDDAAALATAIGILLEDVELATRMGAAGKARAQERFSVARMARRTVEVYRHALASTPPSRTT
jgi:glycosyltransferase involved in cell wall biosynthesis